MNEISDRPDYPIGDRLLLALRDRQLHTLFETTLDAIAIADDQGRYLDVNSAACELFGLEREQLLGCYICQFAESKFYFQQVWQEFQHQEKVRGEFRLVRTDGDIRIVEYAATANFLPHCHLLVMRDITAYKQAEAQVRELTQQLDRQVRLPVNELAQTQAQLQQSQQRLESILNSIEGVVWSIHPETFETIYINPAVEPIFGCAVAEFFANPNLWLEIIHPDDRSIITNAFIQLEEKGKTRKEYRIIRPDGQVRWLSVNSYLVYDQIGKPIRIDGITTDISDRIESQSRLQQIARHIPGIIYQFRQRTDGTFHFPYASEGMREIYGLSPEEVCEDAAKIFSLIHPDDLDFITQSLLDSATHLTPWHCKYRVCLADGRMLWLLGNATPQREPDGSTLWHGYIRDISDQKNREIAFRESETKFTTIFNTSPDPAWISTLTAGRCLNVNESLCQLLEVTAPDIIGKTCVEIGLWDDLKDLYYFRQTLIREGSIQNFEVVIRTSSRQAKTVLMSATVQRLDGQDCVIGMLKDISDRQQVETALRKSEARFQRIALSSPGIIYIIVHHLDKSKYFEYISSAVTEIFEVSVEQVMDNINVCLQLFHPDDMARFGQAVAHSIETLQPFQEEWRIITPTGKLKWIQASGRPERRENGEIAWYGIMLDISKQQVALRERKAAQLELEQFFNIALDLLCIADLNGYFRRLNCAWETILGYDVSELEGQLFLDFVHPDDIAATLAVMSDLSEQKPIIQFTNRYRAKDGNYRYIEWRSFPCGDLIYAAARDITERKQAEIENWQMQNFLNSIIENIPNMLFVKDAKNLQFLRFNKAGEELLGYPKEALLGKNDYDFFPPAEADFFIAKDREVLAQGNVLDIPEEHIQTKHQGTRILHTRKIPILDEFGNPKYLLGISEDITESKQAEIQLKEISERLSLALKSGGIGCWEWDLVDNTLLWDERMYELYGVNKNSNSRLAYDIWANGIHPDDRDAAQTLGYQTILGEAEYNTEFRVVHPDGSIHFIKAFALVRRDAEGNPQKMIGVNFDISEQQAALRDRQRQEQALRLIVEGTAAKTGEEFFKTCVQYLAQVLEVRYAFIAEFIDSEKLAAKTLAFWIGDNFGDNFTYNLVGAPCENVYTQGELCIYPDSVQSLFPQDADLVTLQVQSYAGLPIIDTDGNSLGLLAVLDNKPMVQNIEMQSAILRIFATRAGAEMERMQSEAALRASEIQLRQQTEELEAILKKLQNTQTQLIQAEKMSSLGQLVAGVAHEINNPVSFIYSNIQPATNYASDLIELVHLYQQHYPSPPQAIADLTKNIDFQYLAMDFSKLLASMKTGATRIKDIVKSLRTFSRLDEANFKAIDIHENIDSTLVILQNRLNGRAGEPKIHVIKNYGDLPLVECYGGLLNQVFMNLFVNGIDAIEQQRERLELAGDFDYTGKIIITTAITSENQVLISIQDNGCGMSPEVQAQIFNPFFTTKPIGKGTGMGLANSYQIIEEQHQGSILVNSTLGEGTEFAITLSIKVRIR